MSNLNAQIAARYWGAKVKALDKNSAKDFAFTGKMIGISHNGHHETIFLRNDTNHSDWFAIPDCQLVLTPLDKISDEDAIFLATLIDKNSVFSSDVRYEFKMCEAHNYVNNIDYLAPCIQRIVGDTLCGLEIIGEHLLNKIDIIDFLRSKFYDIDGLIESGIAVEDKH